MTETTTETSLACAACGHTQSRHENTACHTDITASQSCHCRRFVDPTGLTPERAELERHTYVATSPAHAAIEDFVTWLVEASEYQITKVLTDEHDHLIQHTTVDALLAQYHGLDLDKVEEGRNEMLDKITEMNR